MISQFLQRLMLVRQFDMNCGEIGVLGIKHQMLPVNFLKQFNSINPDKSYQISKEAMIEDTKNYFQKLGKDKQNIIKNISNIFGLFGLGELEICDLNHEQKSAILKITDPEFKNNYTANDKICHSITAGILAGIFSYLFEENADCKEIQCMAYGYDSCKFIVKKEF